jgi:hypothetical protein
MKQLTISILFLIICFTTKAQLKDTVFLKREIDLYTPPVYHAIFIDTTQKIRNLITDFGFGTFDSSTYFQELHRIKNQIRSHQFPKSIPKKWVSLYLYKNEYYLYAPSDWGYSYKFEITDTTTIDYGMEGPEPSVIKSIVQLSSSEVVINRKNNWNKPSVKIKVIDPDRGIAVITFGSSTKKGTEKRLMVSVDKAYKFKAIVNYCDTDKVFEWDFEKVDFSKIEQ